MNASLEKVSIGAQLARRQLPSILAATLAGRTTIITRHGREIAAAVPAASLKKKN